MSHKLLSTVLNKSPGILCATITPAAVIAGALFWTTFDGILTPAGAFSTLAIIYLSLGPLRQLLGAYSSLLSALACVNRIQAFLLLEAADGSLTKESGLDDTSSSGTDDEKDYVASFENATIAVQSDRNKIVLRDVSLRILKSEVVVMHGPVGSGKTTFLRSLIGSAKLASGTWDMPKGPKAYCSQTPWLRNVSIRDNIIGFNEYDAEWYDTVIETCLLREDLELLPDNDSFVVGSSGLNLSGGQKQRVVGVSELTRYVYGPLANRNVGTSKSIVFSRACSFTGRCFQCFG